MCVSVEYMQFCYQRRHFSRVLCVYRKLRNLRIFQFPILQDKYPKC